jgi:glycopeptide antibiotics resistance protein
MDQLRMYEFALGRLAIASVAIVIAASGLALLRARRSGWRVAVARSLSEAILAVGLAAIFLLTIMPLVDDGVLGAAPPLPVNLVPILPLVAQLQSGEARWVLVTVIANIALYVPLGMGLAWRLGLRIRWAVLAGLLVTIGAETWQAFSPDRASDITDVLLNVLGTYLGALAGVRLARVCREA